MIKAKAIHEDIKDTKLQQNSNLLVYVSDVSILAKVELLGTLRTYFREGNGTPLQYSCLENPMDGGAWWAAVHGVAKSQTRLSDFTFTFHFHAFEKEMATHSSVLAWRLSFIKQSMKQK